MSTVALFGTAIPVPHGPPDLNVNAVGSLDGSLGVTADRVRVIAGRLFNPADPDAAMIDPQLAAREHLRPGGIVHLPELPDRIARLESAHRGIEHAVALATVRFDAKIFETNAPS